MSAPLPRTFGNLVLQSAFGLAVFTVLASLLLAIVVGWSLSGVSTQPGLVLAMDFIIFAFGLVGWGGLTFVCALFLTVTVGAVVVVFAGAPLVALVDLVLSEVTDWRAHAIGSGIAGSIAASIVVVPASVIGPKMTILYATIDFWPTLSLGLIAIAGFGAAAGWFITWQRHARRQPRHLEPVFRA